MNACMSLHKVLILYLATLITGRQLKFLRPKNLMVLDYCIDDKIFISNLRPVNI
jgi:hypothetical protein